MAEIISSNKTIAKNTVIIYTRLFVTIVVGLLSSRYVLLALGASDFGLYNVVGSIIALYAFISSSLSSTTVRFLNYELGKEDGNINRMFNICNVLHISMALIILLLSETVGVWYINNYLNVAPGKEADAMFVFQISIIVSCFGIMNVPYQSLYNVHEKFLFPALLDVFVTLLKFAFVLLLVFFFKNNIRFYAVSMSLLTLVYFVVYHIYVYREWPEIIKWSFVKEWKAYREVVRYNNYTILQTLSTTARNQGSNILVNLFFGTIVNAAFAVANTLQNYVVMFMGTLDSASAPQITQNIASGNMKRASYLTNTICRMVFLMCEAIILPLYVEMDFILKLWLKTPPENTTIFCRLILLIALVAATSGGMFQFINASGKVKWFRISVSVCFLSCLPLGYFAFKMGFPSYSILVLFIISDILNRLIFLILMRVVLRYDVKTFLLEAYLRPFVIFIIMSAFVWFYPSLSIQSSFMHFVGLIGSFILSILLVYAIGLKQQERTKILDVIAKRVHSLGK